MSTATGKLGTAIHSVTGGNTTGDAEVIDAAWSKLYGSCNERTVLYTLPRLCHNAADACDKYADAVDHAHSKAERELGAAGVLGAVLLGVGGFLTPETGGASDAGAIAVDVAIARGIMVPIAGALLATVGGLSAGALAEYVIHATEDSASNAPNVRPTDANTTNLQSALDREVGIMQSKQRSRDTPRRSAPKSRRPSTTRRPGCPTTRRRTNGRCVRRCSMRRWKSRCATRTRTTDRARETRERTESAEWVRGE
ncbi:hypothetical protein ACQPZ8_01905 [Actinomadura nitritigenes]|uniref:hypothetical protein n=1 Tax=Actinomadura nitritigenes TaxID=134602 RepID=UPI003D89B6B9